MLDRGPWSRRRHSSSLYRQCWFRCSPTGKRRGNETVPTGTIFKPNSSGNVPLGTVTFSSSLFVQKLRSISLPVKSQSLSGASFFGRNSCLGSRRCAPAHTVVPKYSLDPWGSYYPWCARKCRVSRFFSLHHISPSPKCPNFKCPNY